ncbi:CHC2 zinc finger domain-containing protein [Bosea psychrotolerans]|uniref:DNA primase n=1 Tax=Bosea psychrotolerans TaxID=1871628 RepID=A0A2S4MH59_9HYPH|nr:CHC2 zinc finger domain-containing protein [Bosea psychrotolerans]POR54088.1 DNA primase [Bosea psychrotolerans]
MFDLERIKTIPIAAVARDFGFKLSQTGAGRCLLPGHDDKNPSFSIRRLNNSFRCFACGRHGSVIDLVIEMEGVSFNEACSRLRDRYVGAAGKGRPRQMRAPTKVIDVDPPVPDIVADQEVFGWLLDQSPLLASGRDYMVSRSISHATLEHFKVGQVANRQTLVRVCIERFGLSRLQKCGLVTDTRFGPELIFPSGYLLFPFVSQGAVQYIQARRSDAMPQRRWISLAKLPPPIFNLDILATGVTTVAICEGVTDVLSAHELSRAALGLLGASSKLSKEAISGLRNRNVIIMADADAAGSSFAQRTSKSLQALGVTVALKSFPPGVNDLNDYLRIKRGNKAS